MDNLLNTRKSFDKTIFYIIGMTVLILIITVVSLGVGQFPLSTRDIFSIVFGIGEVSNIARNVFIHLRLPRVMMALLGALIGQGAKAVIKAFPNHSFDGLIEKEVIDQADDFDVLVNKVRTKLKNISDIDMLYYQTYLLENLGFCLFASFAIINNNDAMDLLTKMFRLKTGNNNAAKEDLILYGQKCIKAEIEYLKANGQSNARESVPHFTKVLYRYFSSGGN